MENQIQVAIFLLQRRKRAVQIDPSHEENHDLVVESYRFTGSLWSTITDEKITLPVKQQNLKTELRTAPMATLCIVADLGIRLVSEPIGDLPVLLGLAGEFLLDQKCFLSRLCRERKIKRVARRSIKKIEKECVATWCQQSQ
jgi:hypothetical protein